MQFLCQLYNISQCLEIDGAEQVPTIHSHSFSIFLSFFLSFFQQFTLTLWNPTIHAVTHHPRIPVRTDYTVYDVTGQPLTTEVQHRNNA